MKWAAAIVVVVLTGCDWILGLRGGFTHDAPYVPDSETFFDAPPAGIVCIGAHLGVHLCFLETDLMPLTLPPAIDTDAAACQAPLTDGTIACVLSGTTVAIATNVVATGSRPLVIVASENVTVNTTLDVSRAGANDVGCFAPAAGIMQGTTDVTAGGGAGGSFAGRGGNGGPASNVIAVAAPPLSMVTKLRGGCGGGNGGLDHDSMGAGLGGSSGGAVYIASKVITVTGAILATGMPSSDTGSHSSGFPGGGGGGSGGMIALDGMTITITPAALLLASGASGGGGGDNVYPGLAGSVPTGVGRAPGGGASPLSDAGDGGDSSGAGALDGLDGHPMRSTQGGAGGGGGGAGFIKLFSPNIVSNGTVVPAAS